MIDFFIKKGDVLPIIRAEFTNEDGTPVDVTNAQILFNYQVRSSGTTVVQRTGEIESAESGIVNYQWITGDSLTAGLYKGEFIAVFNGGQQQTFPQGGFLIFEVMDDVN